MTPLLGRVSTWHRPMMWTAAVMAAMAVVSASGLVFDDRVLLGAPIWLKPFKFAVSIAAYCVTWAWLLTLLQRGRRAAHRISTAIVAIFAVEYVIIVAQVIRGRASHFNAATSFDAALFGIMGISIAALWTATLVLTILLLRTRVADRAARWAILLGGFISLAGIGLGALMLGPTDEQARAIGDGRPTGFIGAHSVGVADGGPTMPVTGWSTTGGDLRIPHFVGMHALQALPLLALALTLLAKRFARLRDDVVRTRLVLVAGLGYAGLLALVTWQALRGQSLIHPDARTLIAFAALVIVVVLGAFVALNPRRGGDGSASPRMLVFHFIEMAAAMGIGMAVFGPLVRLAFGAAGWSAALGFTDLRALIMATEMSVAIVAWMRFRGHGWSSIAEMTAAMYVPFVVLLPPYWAGLISGGVLMGAGHGLMLAAMAASVHRHLAVHRRQSFRRGASSRQYAMQSAESASIGGMRMT